MGQKLMTPREALSEIKQASLRGDDKLRLSMECCIEAARALEQNDGSVELTSYTTWKQAYASAAQGCETWKMECEHLRKTLHDAVMLIVRLAHAVTPSAMGLQKVAFDWIKRNNLQPSILRDDPNDQTPIEGIDT